MIHRSDIQTVGLILLSGLSLLGGFWAFPLILCASALFGLHSKAMTVSERPMIEGESQ